MQVVDRLAFPLLAFLSPEQSRRLGLTPIDDERIEVCLTRCRGTVLDVGCQFNRLVRRYPGRGVGLDVFPWPGVDVLGRPREMPFPSAAFDTVTMTAVLNHVPAADRVPTLSEIRRVLKDDGYLLITMIGPRIGWITHRLREAHDPDQTERGIGHDESLGLSDSEVCGLVARAGFVVREHTRFVWGLNNLYVCQKAAG
jgi:SAM-dependent methyltransferase